MALCHTKNKNPSAQWKFLFLCTPEQPICVFPTHFSSLGVRSYFQSFLHSLKTEKNIFSSLFLSQAWHWMLSVYQCLNSSNKAISLVQLWAAPGKAWALSWMAQSVSHGLRSPNPEFFLHISMDEVLLWTIHSSRNDRCQFKLQNSPTLHSWCSPPINNGVLLLSRKTLLVKTPLCTPRTAPPSPLGLTRFCTYTAHPWCDTV